MAMVRRVSTIKVGGGLNGSGKITPDLMSGRTTPGRQLSGQLSGRTTPGTGRQLSHPGFASIVGKLIERSK